MAFCISRISFAFLLIIFGCGNAWSSDRDTLNIRYEIITQSYFQEKDIIKIKVPPFLSTSEVMEQVRLVLQWPGEPPPKKLTSVYVFKETDQIGETSITGGTFVPGKGIMWSLSSWEPIKLSLSEPTIREKIIYNTLLDTLFSRGLSMSDMDAKNEVAEVLGITRTKLDSIYFKVKYWNSQ